MSRSRSERFLTAAQARRVYDRIGRGQDAQMIFEHQAISDLLAHAGFERADAVFELGYGTGALADRLLRRYLRAESRYTGIEVSPHMHDLARRRLHAYLPRAELRLSEGELRFPFPDAAFDRFIATYVLDLLSNEDISTALREAHRLLLPGGLLCLVSLTPGATVVARGITRVWESLWSIRPELVGGCRPVTLVDLLDLDQWTIRHHTVVTTLGVSSEVVVAAVSH
jgi:ubiquinone/menaquinone biosynthesis C-methylase UbiE